jgi:hypothetical protein
MGRIEQAKPWCAVIAETEHIAEQYIVAFGLSREIWEPRTHGESPVGLSYDRIVIIRPHWRVTPEQYSAFQAQAAPWMRAVAPDGHFKII